MPQCCDDVKLMTGGDVVDDDGDRLTRLLLLLVEIGWSFSSMQLVSRGRFSPEVVPMMLSRHGTCTKQNKIMMSITTKRTLANGDGVLATTADAP